MYMGKEGRKGERKRIILGDYWLQIQVSMSVLVQISFHFQALHILSLFVFSFSWNPLCLKSQSLFGLINLILCMSIDILPRRYIHTLLSSCGWLTSLRNDPLRSIRVDTCGHVTPGSVSGRGVLETVDVWPQVQGLRVGSPLRVSTCDLRCRVWGLYGSHSSAQVRIMCTWRPPSLPFSCSMSCSPKISNIWVEGVAWFTWSFFSSCCIHMRSGALGQLCSVFCWVTDNPLCAVSECHLRFCPWHSEARPLTPHCGGGKEACIAHAEHGVQGR